MNSKVRIQTNSQVNVIGFDVAKCAAQLLYGPVLVCFVCWAWVRSAHAKQCLARHARPGGGKITTMMGRFGYTAVIILFAATTTTSTTTSTSTTTARTTEVPVFSQLCKRELVEDGDFETGMEAWSKQGISSNGLKKIYNGYCRELQLGSGAERLIHRSGSPGRVGPLRPLGRARPAHTGHWCCIYTEL